MNCPLCKTAAARDFAEKHSLTYKQCVMCGLVYTDTTGFDYARHNAQTSNDQLERHKQKHTARRHSRTYRRLLRSFAKYQSSGQLLEIGCSTGGFLAHARSAGWSTTGIEPARRAAEYAIKEHGLDVRICNLSEASLASDNYDCVYSNAVLEHLADPLAVVKETFRVLRPGGVMYADTVNLDSYTWQFLGLSWRLLDPRAHLCLFTPRTLETLCDAAGFKIVRFKSHGVRFRSNNAPALSQGQRVLEELRKAPYSIAARHKLKGDSIAVLARKPTANE